MKREVWIFGEHRDGVLQEVTLEILTKAREIADKLKGPLSAVLIGNGLSRMVKELIDFGADTVHLIEHPYPFFYPSRKMVDILCEWVGEYRPDIFLFGATSLGSELAPKVAARLKTGLSAHCLDLGIDEKGHLLQIVPAFGGGVLATITCPEGRPQMATIKPGVMKIGEKGERSGNILKRMIVPESESDIGLIEILREEVAEIPLEKAEVVIAGGWGVTGKEEWERLEQLSVLLKGAVGATRPAVDEGWAKDSQMIGQSGKTVRPKLYMGFGISGMMHHMVGIQDSDFVIAVNSDPNAEIFKMCDFGVVGDLREILPHLIEEIRKKMKE
jgi:electron transfer flavoprotein alpha subunit